MDADCHRLYESIEQARDAMSNPYRRLANDIATEMYCRQVEEEVAEYIVYCRHDID